MGHEKLSSDDHSQAANELDSLLKFRNVGNRNGIGHLRTLIGRKNMFAYRHVSVEEKVVRDTVIHAKRFGDWAEETGMKLKIEGWSNE
jgi:hypothetical protein